MPWVAINSCSGISDDFRTLPTPEQKRLLPQASLPINVLNFLDLDHLLNNSEKIRPDEGEKETVLVEGYYPPVFGVWATHKLYRITYKIQNGSNFIIAKIMDRGLGEKEFSVLTDLYKFMNVPKPFGYMYDEELEEEFSDVKGIFWMSFIDNHIRIEECLRKWCIGEQDRFELKNLNNLLTSLWDSGVKHNDLKGEHLLYSEGKWFIIDFEKSDVFRGEEDMNDEISVLIGDCSVYLDGFVQYNRINFDGEIQERYETAITKILNSFDVKLKNNRYISVYMQVTKNAGIRSSIERCIS